MFALIKAFTVTTTAQLIVDRNPKRKALLIFNNDTTATVYVTDSPNSLYTQGIPIPPKANYENLHFCQGAYYIICASGTVNVRVEEDIDA